MHYAVICDKCEENRIGETARFFSFLIRFETICTKQHTFDTSRALLHIPLNRRLDRSCVVSVKWEKYKIKLRRQILLRLIFGAENNGGTANWFQSNSNFFAFDWQCNSTECWGECVFKKLCRCIFFLSLCGVNEAKKSNHRVPLVPSKVYRKKTKRKKCPQCAVNQTDNVVSLVVLWQ